MYQSDIPTLLSNTAELSETVRQQLEDWYVTSAQQLDYVEEHVAEIVVGRPELASDAHDCMRRVANREFLRAWRILRGTPVPTLAALMRGGLFRKVQESVRIGGPYCSRYGIRFEEMLAAVRDGSPNDETPRRVPYDTQ